MLRVYLQMTGAPYCISLGTELEGRRFPWAVMNWHGIVDTFGVDIANAVVKANGKPVYVQITCTIADEQED